MLQAINNWGDYRNKVREFDAVMEHAKAVASALVGQAVPAAHIRYGEQIFMTLLTHCISLRTLAGDANQRMPGDLWGVPPMSAVARCVVEAFDAFEYVAGHDVGASERAFRLLLWELHDQARLLRMAGKAGPGDARAEALQGDVRRLRAELEGHPFLGSLPAELQAELRRRLARGEPPAFHLGQRQRCAMSGVDADWHHAVTAQLAQYVHTLPSTVRQLSSLKVETPEALRVVAMPLLFALPFLVRATQTVVQRMRGTVPEPPSRTARTMALWRAVAEPGGAGKPG
jgi:uncharacterized protein YjiS (DUF1127 family)